MLEKNLQQKIVAKLKTLGYCIHKIESRSCVGFPDILAISPEGVVYFFELKTEKGRLSKLQERTIKKLRANNANVYVVRSVDEVINIIESNH